MNEELKNDAIQRKYSNETLDATKRRAFIKKGIGFATCLADIAATGIGVTNTSTSQALEYTPVIKKKILPAKPNDTNASLESIFITEGIKYNWPEIDGKWKYVKIAYRKTSPDLLQYLYSGNVAFALNGDFEDVHTVYVFYDFSFRTSYKSGTVEGINRTEELIPETMYFALRRRADEQELAIDKSTVRRSSFSRELTAQCPSTGLREQILLPMTWIAVINLFRSQSVRSKRTDLGLGSHTTPLGTLVRTVQGGWYVGAQLVTYSLRMNLIPAIFINGKWECAIDKYGAMNFYPEDPDQTRWFTPTEYYDLPSYQRATGEFFEFKAYSSTYHNEFSTAYWTAKGDEFGLLNNLFNGLEKYIPIASGVISTTAGIGSAYAVAQDNNGDEPRNILVMAAAFLGVFGVSMYFTGRWPGLWRGRATLGMLYASGKMAPNIVVGVATLADTFSSGLFDGVGDPYSLTRFNWWLPDILTPFVQWDENPM